MKQWTLELDSKWECNACGWTDKGIKHLPFMPDTKEFIRDFGIVTIPGHDAHLSVSCSRCSYTEAFKPLDGDDDE